MKKSIKGFSALELLLTLPIVLGLLLIANSILIKIATIKRNNLIADQMKVYQTQAIMYINDHYRELALQLQNSNEPVIIKATQMHDYLYDGQAPQLSIGEAPCLYMLKKDTSRLDSIINAYLIFGNVQEYQARLPYKDNLEIAHAAGGGVGVLVKNNNSFKIDGGNFATYLQLDNPLELIDRCGWRSSAGDAMINNALIMDLTQNKLLFQQLANTNLPNDSNPPKNPSLQTSGDTDATSMRTNLYLDNVISESETNQVKYCSASEIKDDPLPMCTQFANDNGYTLLPGSCSWSSSVLTKDDQCASTVKGNYEKTVMGCQNSNFGDPNQLCKDLINSYKLIAGSASWNNKAIIDNQCQATSVASYVEQNCDYKCTFKGAVWNEIPIYDCGSAITGLCYNGHLGLLTIPPIDSSEFVHGTLYPDGCHVNVLCLVPEFPKAYTLVATPNSGSQSSMISCGNRVTALTPDSVTSLGYLTSNTFITQVLIKNVFIPAIHNYHALIMGRDSSNRVISIQTDAPNGAAINTSQLDINNAGLQSGFIAPVSHYVAMETPCLAKQLGVIAQQQDRVGYVQGQLRCTYNQSACPINSGGYCFLPVTATTVNYRFNQVHHLASCADGLVVDPNQPQANIDTNFQCPDLRSSGKTLFEKVHGEMANCTPSAVPGLSFCSSYQTVCSYKDMGNNGVTTYAVSALLGLQCMQKNHTYVMHVDHL